MIIPGNRKFRCLVGAMLLGGFVVSGSPSTAWAGPQEEAVERYKRGLELFEEGDFTAALLEFNAAYKLSPTYKLLYNVGLVNKQINDYAKALDALQRYLAEGGSEVSESRRSEVRAEIEKLKKRVAKLDVRSNLPAEVAIDDSQIGLTPLPGALSVNIGRRRITARAQGFEPQTKQIDVVAGETPIVVDFKFERVVEAAKPSDPPSFPIVPWIITGALGAGTVVTGIIALNKNNQYEKDKTAYFDRYPATATNPAIPATPDKTVTQKLDESKSSAKTMALVSDIFLAGTVISAGLSTYFTIRYIDRKKTYEREPKPKVTASMGIGSVSLQGSF